MKNLLILWQRTALCCAVQCRTSASRDIKDITTRFEHEGSELLTLTLPRIGQAFESSLDRGEVSDDLKSLTGLVGGFPRLFGNFLRLVFERSSCRLLENPDINAIQSMRQLTLMFGKVLFPCSDARNQAAFTKYLECEQSLNEANPRIEGLLEDFKRVSTMLFGDVLHKVDEDVYFDRIIPKHGPGATADKLRNNAKYRQHEWTRRLEAIFPAGEFLLPNWRYHHMLDTIKWLEPETERPVRVISVPKTMKTPRIIAIEPTCMQYMQQGLLEKFVEYLEKDFLVRDMIGFTDQEPNQLLAREGSRTGSLATLDLSEASDRVSMQLVNALLESTSWLSQAVNACRSKQADVPGYGVLPLSKFASMGSALTFPMEELVFLTGVFMGIESALSRHLSRGEIASFSGKVRIYGDDIIIPVEYVQPVVVMLELLGFIVNHKKSFWTGKFRESCGKEYYDGYDVSIVRVRRDLPQHRADAPGVLSIFSLRNQFYFAGNWGVCSYLDQLIEELHIPSPVVGVDSPVLGRNSHLGYETQKIDPNLQVPLVKGFVVRNRTPDSYLEGEGALLKWFLKRGSDPFADRHHLERQGRPDTVGIKVRWGRAY